MRGLLDALDGPLPWIAELPLGSLFGAGHAAAFAALAVVAAALRRPMGATRWQAAALLALVALASEALQRHLPDRSPSVEDLVMDLTGAGLGVAGWLAWRAARPPSREAEP